MSLDAIQDQTEGDWRKVYVGGKTYDDNFSAGTAAITIRRSDDSGIQLVTLQSRSMEAVIRYGLKGWVWTAPSARSWQTLTNPVWIAVNAVLRAKGLRNASMAVATQHFDVQAAIAAAAICEQTVPRVFGGGTEQQFTFQGIIAAEKPLCDWIDDILRNCLGYYTFANRKFKPGIRINSSAVEAFTEGNIIFGSLSLRPLEPTFNHLTAYFNNKDTRFSRDSLPALDEDHAQLAGVHLKAQIELTGTTSRSQAARIAATRLREELGGINAEQWRSAREISFRTTILALAVEPGMVCSLTHPLMPNGAGEFRVTAWRLNKDYSIEIAGRTTVDDMYDLTAGPKPVDVEAAPIPVEGEIVESPFAGIEEARTNAAEALEIIADWAADDKFDPLEKKRARLEWEIIAGEKAGLEAEATALTIDTEKAAYTAAFQALANYLNNGTTWTSGIPAWISDSQLEVTTPVVRNEFIARFTAYYAAKAVLQNKIASVLRHNAEQAALAAAAAGDTAGTAHLIASQINDVIWDAITAEGYLKAEQIIDGAQAGLNVGRLIGQIIDTQIANVSGAKLVAGSVPVRAMGFLPTSGALNPDPNCTDETAWVTYSGSNWELATVEDGKIGNSVIRSTGAPGYAGVQIARPIPISPTKSYLLHGAVRRKSGDRRVYFFVRFFDSSGTVINPTGLTGWYSLAGGERANWVSSLRLEQLPVGGEWQDYYFTCGYGGTGEIPENAKSLRIGAFLNFSGAGDGTTTDGVVEIQDFWIKERIDSDKALLDGIIGTATFQPPPSSAWHRTPSMTLQRGRSMGRSVKRLLLVMA